MKKLNLTILILSLTAAGYAQNVGINSTGAAPNASAMLDVVSTTSGVLIPRMTAAQRIAIATPAQGLLVYQTDAGTQGSGFYFHNGTIWVPFSTNSGGWGLIGNTGTAVATNYLGTTDAVDFRINTSATERMRFLSTGNIGIGTTTPAYPFTVVVPSTTYTARVENSTAAGSGAFAGRNTAAAGTSTGSGILGFTSQSQGFGLYGVNFNTSGTGLIAVGNNAAGTYLVAGSGASIIGTDDGIVGLATTAASGTGISAAGNNEGWFGLLSGSGGAFTGTSTGVYGFANSNVNGSAGGYFSNTRPNGYAYVGCRGGGGIGGVAGTDYKILGPGTVSTIVRDVDEKRVTMFCPEAPEILFQDYGTGKLVNGKAHIELDPNLAKNITVNEKHPLRVFVQLKGDCKGVYVTNESPTGFDVVELQGGNSNVEFYWTITANRADRYENGELDSEFENVRFPEAPGPIPQVKKEATKTGNRLE